MSATHTINKKGIVKKVTSKKRPHITIANGMSGHQSDDQQYRFKMLEGRINRLQDDLAEMILLGDATEAVSTYSMSAEEYMELPGNARL